MTSHEAKLQEAYEYTRYLVEECGIRIAGSKELRKAAEFVADSFEQWGLSVMKHEFSVPTYSLNSFYLKAKINNEWKSLDHKPVWFAGDTPEGGVKASVVYGGDGSIKYLKEAQPEGKILLIARDTYLYYPDVQLYNQLLEYKPAAVLFTYTDGHKGGIPDVYYNYKSVRDVPSPPSALISFSDAMEIIKAGEVEIQYNAHYSVNEGSCVNVIGTLKGSDPSADSIIVCAHTDTTPGGPGATDDAGGVGTVMALAHHYAELAQNGNVPLRTMHFITWSGHEAGLWGSKAFIIDNPDIVSKVRMVLNYDVVGVPVATEMVFPIGNDEFTNQIGGILQQLELNNWDAIEGPAPFDALNFCAAEIPTVTFGQLGLFNRNHTSADNMDLIAPSGFHGPITFSATLLDWAVNAKSISQGYPESLTGACRGYSEKFGWGLYK